MTSSPRTAGLASTSRRPLWRRRWLRVVAVISAVTTAAVAGFVVVAFVTYQRALTDTVGRVSFDAPLRIPPLYDGELDEHGVRTFELELLAGVSELLPGRRTPTWGVNGSHLGPTLRMRRDDTVRVEVTNRLDQTTTLHWHGMRLPAAADGGPHSPIMPGGRWSPSWTVDQRAASLWYHPHPHGSTMDHVLRGLAGLIIIDDDEADGLGLPDVYGVDDIPVIIQDVSLDNDGSISTSTPTFGSVGPLGDHVLVNGTFGPHLDVTTSAVRLRLVNASAGRIYDLGFDDRRTFRQIASDGGLLDASHVTDRVVLSPGERAEIVVEMEPGSTTVLRSSPPQIGVEGFQARFAGLHDRFDVLELRALARLSPSAPVPSRLGTWEGPDPASAVASFEVALQGRRRINGREMDMSRIDHVVAAGTTEVWDLRNDSGDVHNLHVHDVQFRILELDGRPPPPELRGPKDTVLLPPRSRARIALTFGNHADERTPFMVHCHVLRHEDDGMMAQFLVVEPGDVDDVPRIISHPPGH